MGERSSLEFEVNYHRARVAELVEALRDLEERISQAAEAPPELERKAEAIRMELKGRTFALAVGSSRLMVLPADDLAA
jgi:chromosome segregation ATPase